MKPDFFRAATVPRLSAWRSPLVQKAALSVVHILRKIAVRVVQLTDRLLDDPDAVKVVSQGTVPIILGNLPDKPFSALKAECAGD
jgi:hypothetical protein